MVQWGPSMRFRTAAAEGDERPPVKIENPFTEVDAEPVDAETRRRLSQGEQRRGSESFDPLPLSDIKKGGKKKNSRMSSILKGFGTRARHRTPTQKRQTITKAWHGASKLVRDVGDTVTSVTINADLVAGCGTNKRALVYSTFDGEMVAEFTAESGVNAILISRFDSTPRLIVGTFAGWIRIYGIYERKEEHAENGDAVHCMAVNASGDRLAVAGKAKHIHLYGLIVADGVLQLKLLCRFHVVSGGTVLSVALDSNALMLAAGGESKVVQLWKVPIFDEAGELVEDVTPTVGSSSPHGKRGVSPTRGTAAALVPTVQSANGGADAAATPAERPPISATTQFRTASPVHSLALTSVGDALAVGTNDHTEIYKIDAFVCEPLLLLDSCPAPQGGVAFSSLETKLAIGGNQNVYVFDLETGGMLVKMESAGRVRCVALSDDGSSLVVGGFDRKLQLHMINRGTELVTFRTAERTTVVRSCHLSTGSAYLAMGTEFNGKGEAIIWDTRTETCVHSWPQPKAVWAVRFNVDAKLLAVGGYEMCVHLYHTKTHELLQTIKYKPLAGPAFIWSVTWSADGTRFAVACWNTSVYLYHVDPDVADRASATETPLTEICSVKRTDRVYSVGLDLSGYNMVVGGRDKKVAMFDCEHAGYAPSQRREARLVWDVQSDDFIYTVAVSQDMQTVAFGGTAKTVHVLSATSGTLIFTVPCSGVIWSLAVLEDPKGDKLVIGGELPVLTVVDTSTQEDYLQIPVAETTYDVAITKESIAYTSSSCATMFGAGGTASDWDEQPSYLVMTSWIQAMLSSEEQLLHLMGLILERHPAVVNASHPEKRSSLVQYVIQSTNQPNLLEKMMNANVRLGLPRDVYNRSPLHVAIEHGKWRALQLIIDALLNSKFSFIPGSMSIVSECLEMMAYKYPLDFLHLIASFQLQPEPEILGDADASDVMLPRRLLCGSDRRCPKGVWGAEIEEYRVVVGGVERASETESAAGQCSASLPRGSPPRPRIRRKSCARMDMDNGAPNGGAASNRSSDASESSVPADSGIEFGFASHSTQTGVQAFRIPLENFAALAGHAETLDGGTRIAPLQLVVEAVSATHVDYSVFGSKLIEILLEYKWSRFAKKKFIMDFFMFLVNVAVVTLWNFVATITVTSDDGLTDDFIRRVFPVDENSSSSTDVLVFLLWLLNSLFCIANIITLISDISNQGMAFFRNVYGCLNVIYLPSQVVINTLFFTRREEWMGEATQWIVRYNITDQRRSLYAPSLYHDDALGSDWLDTAMGSELDWHEGRALKAHASAGMGGQPTGMYPSVFILLQAMVTLIMWMRLLFYFKGVLALGALVHSMQKIIKDSVPLLTLILVLMVAFWASTWVLINVELTPEDNPEWRNPASAFLMMINMGLYTSFDTKLVYYGRHWLVQVLTQIYMIAVQIILLNMMIAIMAESLSSVTSVSKFVAQFERAKLVLQWEHRLAQSARGSNTRWRAFGRKLKGLPSGRGEDSFNTIFPRWLHVLEPADHRRGRDEDKAAKEQFAAVKALRVSLKEQQEQTTRLAAAVAAATEENRRFAVTMKETQEWQSNALERLQYAAGLDVVSEQQHIKDLEARRQTAASRLEPAPEAASTANGPANEQAPATAPGSKETCEPFKSSWLSAIFSPASHRTAPNKVKLTTINETTAAEAAGGAVPAESVAGTADGNGVKRTQEDGERVRRKSVQLPALVISVPMPDPLERPTFEAGARPLPSTMLAQLSSQCSKPDMDLARQAASRLRDMDYTLKMFHDDICGAFPELRWYHIKEAEKTAKLRRQSALKSKSASDDVTSGLSAAEEYLRTIGAFFAVYWLMRIGIDGEKGFSFGVDEQWRPLSAPRHESAGSSKSKSGVLPPELGQYDEHAFYRQTPHERAQAFYENTAWTKLLEQLHDAELLKKTSNGSWEVCVERTVGLLALTAIHDIMKMDVLLPTVQPEHAPFEGFQEGDRINDHDIALGYVLEYYRASLPSYGMLAPELRRTIRFTQSKLAFNHGWLVQAEAPPGPLFSKFKTAIRKSENLALPDLAFYFVHWLTDLAGAEPTPLRGCEKCVVKFPHAVLHSFISSFTVVNSLIEHRETDVFEAYLQARWAEIPQLGAPPTGENAIALMRLVVQAQQAPLQQRVAAAYSQLDQDDRQTLALEMSLTGVKGQAYSIIGQAGSKASMSGPAFLIYYSPAFMRTAARTDAVSGLRMLAEIYREARSLWPHSPSRQGETVTLRVDQIKERSPARVMDGHQWGECWQLVKRNELEGVVEQHAMYDFNMVVDGRVAERRLLAFWRSEHDDDDDEIAVRELEVMRRRMKRG